MAVHQAGGADALDWAMARRQVLKGRTGHGDLYLFPKVSFGSIRSLEITEQVHQQQEVSQDRFQKYSNALQSCMMPSVDTSVVARMSAGSSSMMALQNTPSVDLQLIRDKQDRLMKAVLVGDRCKKLVQAETIVPDKISKLVTSLDTLLEKCELMGRRL